MHLKINILFPILLILFVSLACSLPTSGSEPTEEEIANANATSVAATLTALAPTPASELPTEVVNPPADTPAPEAEPTASEPTPKFKPDILKLAAVDANGNLVVWQEGSSSVTLITSADITDVALSPDGEWVVYVRSTPDHTDASLWAIRFNGLDQKQLVSTVDFMSMNMGSEISDPADVTSIMPSMMKFIPGTHTLAFTNRIYFQGPGVEFNEDLWFVNVDTGEQRSFLSPGQAGQFYFSPDGQQMALVVPDRIDLLNTDGSNRRYGVLTYPFVYTYSEYAYYATPVWSPDSTFLRVAIPPQDPLGDPTGQVKIYHIPTDGSMANQLASVSVNPLGGASFAPDVNHYAYKQVIGDPAANQYSLKIADLAGMAPVEFTTGSFNFGEWAPDSSHFYFTNFDPNTTYIGQVGVPGVIALDANPVSSMHWITNESFFFVYQSAGNYQLRWGTLSTPSGEIVNLGYGERQPFYAFVTP